MTAIDVLDVLKRTDGQFARRSGDDPATPEYLKKLADAVRPLVVNGKPAPALPAVDDVQVKTLLADKQRLEDVAVELRKQAESRGKVVDAQKREIAELKQRLAAADADTKRRIDAAVGAITTATGAVGGKVEELRAQLAAKDRETNEARAERDTARAQLRDAEAQPHGGVELMQSDLARLANELAAAQRDRDAANRTLDEIADEQAARPDETHACRWPLAEPGTEPGPCACGKPWPRSAALFEVEEVVPDVDPWADLFGRIRGEVDGRWSA